MLTFLNLTEIQRWEDKEKDYVQKSSVISAEFTQLQEVEVQKSQELQELQLLESHLAAERRSQLSVKTEINSAKSR